MKIRFKKLNNSCLLKTLEIKGLLVIIKPKQTRRARRNASQERVFCFFTIEDAREELDGALSITDEETKLEILRRLRKAGLFQNMSSIQANCQQIDVVPNKEYDFTECTRCSYKMYAPHGWITKNNKLLFTINSEDERPTLERRLNQQGTNFEELLFKTCLEAVLFKKIPLDAAIWVIRQAARSRMATNPQRLQEMLVNAPCWHTSKKIPTTHSICHLPFRAPLATK